MTTFWSGKKIVAKSGDFLIFELKKKFKLKEKRPQAEPKILQLDLWLEPARLGLITSK